MIETSRSLLLRVHDDRRIQQACEHVHPHVEICIQFDLYLNTEFVEPPEVLDTRVLMEDLSPLSALQTCREYLKSWSLLEQCDASTYLDRYALILRNDYSSMKWGFPKIRGTFFWGGPHNKDYSILGSILGSPYFGKLPNTELRGGC